MRNGRRYGVFLLRSKHCIDHCQSFILLQHPIHQLAVVVSSLAQKNPSLALSNIYGSSIANILGSFSIGLLFAPSSLEARELSSARIYTTLLVVLYVFIAGLALPPVRKIIGSHAGKAGILRGRIIGGVLVGIFVIYVAGIAYGIYRGTVIAPEDTDSDSDSDEEEENTTDEEEVAPRAVVVPHSRKSWNAILSGQNIPPSSTLPTTQLQIELRSSLPTHKNRPPDP